MLRFYKTAAIAFLCLLVATALLLYVGMRTAQLSAPIVPVGQGAISWTPRLVPEARTDTGTRIVVKEDAQLLDYNFTLSAEVPYPYASYSMDFGDIAKPTNLLDWTRYQSLSFRIRCSPQNVLLFALFTWDDEVTVPSQHSTYRVSSSFFACGENWNRVELHFADLDTPDWWLQKFQLALTNDRDIRLDKVFGLGFVNSLQSPRQTNSNVKIADLRVTGESPGYYYASAAVTALLWILVSGWLFRRYTAALVAQVQENVKRDLPLVAYQKLTIEPRSGKDKADVISFMAAQYADPDLDLETAVNSLGINRNKINEILKSEIGLTFSGYLNKLRLTEAARLLLEQQDVNVAQIAFAVGYNNVTYFNKLFKNEYGCTPKSFKTLYRTPPTNREE